MVTAGTYGKEPFFADGDRLEMLHKGLLAYARRYEWVLEAWAVFPNHYHFIARAPEQPDTLSSFLRHFHTRSAAWLNRRERTPGRKVWHNFWDTRLTFERSYLARLGYVHQNPVRHGLVPVANQYRWCSAAWFEKVTSNATVRTVYGMNIDRVKVDDDF